MRTLRFVQQFEARGWRYLMRRTELPLEGVASSGALERADLVVWGDDRIHLLDFKHSRAFGVEELAGYRDQLARHAEALKARERVIPGLTLDEKDSRAIFDRSGAIQRLEVFPGG